MNKIENPNIALGQNTAIMAQLKSVTQQAHRDLEKTACLSRLFSKDYQLQEYLQLLTLFYGFYQGLEPGLFASLPSAWQGSLLYRQKRRLLKQDLSVLGVDADTLPLCTHLPQVVTLSQKLGAMYVLEGSTLGGKIIRRQLAAQFGTTVAQALNFYQCYGEQLDTEWRQFACLMSRHFDQAPAEVYDQATSAALETFTFLHAWLDKGASEAG